MGLPDLTGKQFSQKVETMNRDPLNRQETEKVFDEWTEILPTDQAVTVVDCNPEVLCHTKYIRMYQSAALILVSTVSISYAIWNNIMWICFLIFARILIILTN
jgi:hypothetical protein